MNAKELHSKRFQAGLLRSGSPFRGTGVNKAATRRDAEEVVRLAGRLGDYQRYLAQARVFKAEAAGNPAEIDREVLAHARQAAADGRMLAVAALKTVRSMHNGGALDRLVDSWSSAVEAVGKVSLQDEWDFYLAQPKTVEALRNVGVGDDLVAALAAGVHAGDIEVSVEETHLVTTGTLAGRAVSGRLNTARQPARPANVVDLLTRGRFAALVEMFAAGDPAYLQGVPVGDPNDVRPADVALLGAFGTHRELVRHLRKLEDTGLSTVQGAGGIPILIVIGVVIIIIGIAIVAATCDDKETDDPTASHGDCGLGGFLIFLGIALLFSNDDEPDPNPSATNRVMGGPIVHGLLHEAGSVRV